MATLHYDTIIIGAGLSGITAAQELNLAGQKTLILEASSRVGGRIATDELAGRPIELGTMWLRSEDIDLLDFLARNDITPHELDDHQHRCLSSWPSLEAARPFWVRKELQHFQRWFESKVQEIDPQEPWNHPSAGLLDQQTFQRFLEKNTRGAKSRKMLDAYFTDVLGYSLAGLSALDVLHHLRVNHFTFDQALNEGKFMVPHGDLNRLFKNLAFDLNIKLRHPVHEIDQHKNFVHVEGAFFKYTAKHIVISVPAPCLESIKFSPQMANSRRALWNELFSVEIFRMALVLEHADPNFSGLTGKHLIPFSKLALTQLGENQQLLMLEAKGSAALELSRLKQSERLDLVKKIGRHLSISISENVLLSAKYWNDDFWSCGRDLHRPLGSFTAHRDQLAKPEGRIFFAGTDTSIQARGSMEGAIQSGRRAAAELLASSTLYYSIP